GLRVGAADEPEYRGDVPLSTERAEIFARWRRAGFPDPVGGEVVAERRHDTLGGLGVVDDERVAIDRRDLGWPRRARGRCLGVDDPLDRSEHAFAHALVEGAYVQLDGRFAGDDVLLGPGLQRADRDDRRLGGRDL